MPFFDQSTFCFRMKDHLLSNCFELGLLLSKLRYIRSCCRDVLVELLDIVLAGNNSGVETNDSALMLSDFLFDKSNLIKSCLNSVKLFGKGLNSGFNFTNFMLVRRLCILFDFSFKSLVTCRTYIMLVIKRYMFLLCLNSLG